MTKNGREMQGEGVTRIRGLRVGHYTDREGATGCTVVLCEAGAVGGVDVRGASPGTRETDLLRPRSGCRRSTRCSSAAAAPSG